MDFELKLLKTRNILDESAQIKRKLASSELLVEKIVKASDLIIEAYRVGGKVLVFGNGGSAADAQHMVCELIGRFKMDRISLAAIALTTDTSILTAVSNDYGFEKIFSRQVEALVNDGDVIVAISTSGRSKNVLDAVKIAKKKHAKVIGLTGESGEELNGLADVTINIPSDSTPRIQESHITVIHIICELVEQGLFEK